MLTSIWAQARDAQGRPVIGRDGDMPWHLPEDLRHFKELTTGGVVIMGRRTWESLPERFRPMPGRVNIVITSAPSLQGADAVVGSLAEAGEVATRLAPEARLWVMGGGQVYSAAMGIVDALEVTHIDLEVDGDTYAPAIDPAVWTVDSDSGLLDSATGPRHRFVRYVRR
ncbi:dihydrofolate reductase [Demequina sp. B12]|uniref:dihydrofolate reductase n=1 Tax=Demequina sp. B12 TaxID=2992757 RepID=UPI00237A413E|nr:dihydrofolate reductase [Demequina sp. B12]MDE0573371.1 dihydrofolate reductase [Demequina sp. B12]